VRHWDTSGQSVWQFHITRTHCKVALMLRPNAVYMPRQHRAHDGRQQCDSILFAFSVSYQDLTGTKVHVFNPELKTFHQTQPTSIEQRQQLHSPASTQHCANPTATSKSREAHPS
jgi:hypothetical protein